MSRRAILAIRSDIVSSVESEYLEWMTKEHAIERVGIDGFVSARIYRADRSDINRYWILYDLESVAVVDSPAYLDRLNNPTPWSTKMMPQLGNFVRGGGEVIEEFGSGCAAKLFPAIAPEAVIATKEDLKRLVAISHVASAQILQTDLRRTSVPTNEKTMRSGDRIFGNMLLISALDASALNAALRYLPPSQSGRVGPEEGDNVAYSLLFSLTRSNLEAQATAESVPNLNSKI